MKLLSSFLVMIYIIGIIIASLAAASLLDILMALLLSDGMIMTVTCFSVSGIFAAVFCYGTIMEKISGKSRSSGIPFIVLITATAVFLFGVIAPLSGREYNLPAKFFAVALTLMTFITWFGKFYDGENNSGKKNISGINKPPE